MHRSHIATRFCALVIALAPICAQAAFNSGSTGADGAFNPTASATIQLPPDGIFNYTSVNIPAGVTITYKRNAANTPVVILATGDVTIGGIIQVGGGAGLVVGTNPALDYTVPGRGGPGGFDGGHGGTIEVNMRGGTGEGPGGGGGGDHISTCCSSGGPQGGGGAAYRNAGSNNYHGSAVGNTGLGSVNIYGSNLLMPLLGGSGGGGGAGGTVHQGAGGGGGGGAILIAASGTLSISGSIQAWGGNGGGVPLSSGAGGSGCGGGGSGGAIRIVASTIASTNANALNVTAGGGNCSSGYLQQYGGNGSVGRIRSEVATSGTLTLGGFPTLTIASVAGISAPATPTGDGDITLAPDLANPVTVVFNTTGVPVTNTIKLTVTPLRGLGATTVTSAPLTGSAASATASVEVDIPMGSSTLLATTSYTIVASLGDALSRYAKGERVEQIELAATTHGPSMVTLITVSGKRYTVPASELAGFPVG